MKVLLTHCFIAPSILQYYGSAVGKTLFDISLQWSGVARLFLISTIILSLKDAADREEMTSTAFVKLNLLVAAWAGLGKFSSKTDMIACQLCEPHCTHFSLLSFSTKSLLAKVSTSLDILSELKCWPFHYRS